MNRVEQMTAIQKEALELFTRKNADYGDAFAKYGTIGVLMRIEDKIQRALSITKSRVSLVKDEGLEDTLLDLHNYAAMALMLLKEPAKQITTETTSEKTWRNQPSQPSQSLGPFWDSFVN